MRILVVDDDPQMLRPCPRHPRKGRPPIGRDRRPGGGPAPRGDRETSSGAAGPRDAGNERHRLDATHSTTSPMCRRSSCPHTAGTTRSRTPSRWGHSTTSSSHSPRRSWRRGSRQPCASGRRWPAMSGRNPSSLGDLTIDYAARQVHVGDHPVHLTPIEYNLLRVLSLNAGRVLTHDHLLRRGVGHRKHRRPAGGAHSHAETSAQTARRCEGSHVHLYRARRWLPDAKPLGNSSFISNAYQHAHRCLTCDEGRTPLESQARPCSQRKAVRGAGNALGVEGLSDVERHAAVRCHVEHPPNRSVGGRGRAPAEGRLPSTGASELRGRVSGGPLHFFI